MYLVSECTTTSAPSDRGCWRYGEAKVLSTTRRAPAVRATSASAAMSPMPSSGLEGVSTQTIFVRSVSCGLHRTRGRWCRRRRTRRAALEHLREEAEGAAVGVVRDDEVVARHEQGVRSRVSWQPGAGGEGEAAVAALQRQVLLQRRTGRVGAALYS